MRDAVGNINSVLVLGGGSEIATATVTALRGRRCRTVVLAVRDTIDRSPICVASYRGSGHRGARHRIRRRPDRTHHGDVIDGAFDRPRRHRPGDLRVRRAGNQAEFDTTRPPPPTRYR